MSEHQHPQSIWRRLDRHIRTRLTEGLILLIPLVITYVVLRFLVSFIDGLLQPLFQGINGRFFTWLPGLGIITTLVVLYLAGVLVHTVVGRRLVALGTALLTRIPLVRTIYHAAREATEVFAGNARRGAHRASRVVLLEFPREGVRALGLVTGRFRDETGQEFLTVYIPTVPNPTSGYLAIVTEHQVTETDLTVEEAMRIIISGGVLTEEVLKKHLIRGRVEGPLPPAPS